MPHIGEGKETSFSPVKLSERAKSRRSKRDEFKDETVAYIERRIEEIQAMRMERDRLDEMDNSIIIILRDQIRFINKLCKKKE